MLVFAGPLRLARVYAFCDILCTAVVVVRRIGVHLSYLVRRSHRLISVGIP